MKTSTKQFSVLFSMVMAIQAGLTVMPIASAKAAQAQRARAQNGKGSGVYPFPMNGVALQLTPGRYEQYRIDKIEQALISAQLEVDQKDIDFIKSSLNQVNNKLMSLNEIIYDPRTGMMDVLIKQFKGDFDQLTTYLDYAAQAKKIQNEVNMISSGLAAVPSMLAGKALKAEAPVHTFNTARQGVQIDMGPLQKHVEAQFDNILSGIKDREFTFNTAQGLLKLKGLDLNVDPSSTIDLKTLYTKLLEKARLVETEDADFARMLASFNLVGRRLLQQLVETYGMKQAGFGRVINLDEQGFKTWQETAGMYYFVRSRLRLQFGVRLGIPPVEELKAKALYTEFLTGTRPLKFSNGEFIRTDAELIPIRKNIFDLLTLAQTQAQLGAPETMKESTVFSALSVFNFLRSAATGKLLIAKMNVAALSLLYMDIQEEQLTERLDTPVTLLANFKQRYVENKVPEEKAKLKVWNCAFTQMTGRECSGGVAEISDTFRTNFNMSSPDSNQRIMLDFVRDAMGGKMVGAEQSARIRASANKLMESSKTFKDNAKKSHAIDDMFNN